jgi:hypothetical protein
VWVTHTYVERAGRYEYSATEQADVGTPSWRPA